MIGMASDFYRIAFHVLANATKVTIELRPNRFVNKLLTVFGAVNNMKIIFDQGLTHTNGFYSALSGLPAGAPRIFMLAIYPQGFTQC